MPVAHCFLFSFAFYCDFGVTWSMGPSSLLFYNIVLTIQVPSNSICVWGSASPFFLLRFYLRVYWIYKATLVQVMSFVLVLLSDKPLQTKWCENSHCIMLMDWVGWVQWGWLVCSLALRVSAGDDSHSLGLKSEDSSTHVLHLRSPGALPNDLSWLGFLATWCFS